MTREIHVEIKNISPEDSVEITKLIDENSVSLKEIEQFIQKREESKKMTDQSKDEKIFSREEAKVNTYMAEHKGITYREAVLACLDSSEGLPESKKEFSDLTKDEILRAKRNIDDIVYNLSQAKTSEAFNESDQKLLDEAYSKVQEVAKNLQVIVDKQD